MSITLLDVSRNSRSLLKLGIMAQIIETSPIMAMLPFETSGSMRHRYIKEGKLPDNSFRPINSPFSAETKGEFNMLDINLKVLGGEFTVDAMIRDELTHDGATQVSKQLQMRARGLSLDLKKYAFTSDSSVNPNQFDGLQAWSTKYGQDLANGVDLSVASPDPKDIINALMGLDDQLKQFGGATHFVASRGWINQVYAVMIDTSNSVLASQFTVERMTVNGPLGPVAGKTAMFQGRPIIPLDSDSQGADILNNGAGATEVQALSIRPGGFTLVQKYSDGPQLRTKPGDFGDTYYTEWPVGAVAEHEKSVAVSTGWTLA